MKTETGVDKDWILQRFKNELIYCLGNLRNLNIDDSIPYGGIDSLDH